MKTQKNNTGPGLEIAVIGMSGRFPGAGNIEEFWENLKNGVESIIFFSDEDLAASGISQETLISPSYVKAKGYLEGIEYFDAVFFGYKPMEAEQMDPQMRIFYQCVWHALEDAGYPPGRYNGEIGLYAGASVNFSWELLTSLNSHEESGVSRFASGQFTHKDFLCTGISYKLDLQGPSITVQTACSTSLLAIHLACQALANGECDLALAGGTSVSLPGKSGYVYHEGLIVSPDGYCRPFDEKASGTVFGNGAGVVVLKSLEDAIAQRDTIHAVIKGSAINNDGSRKVGFTAPSTKGQARVIRAAVKAAAIDPETIGYIEAHGTGTSLGDTIEIEALTHAFNSNKKQFCRIGSVKSNIGHLDAAAGVAGFIKTVLILKHGVIPPSLHCDTPNPKIGFEKTPFYVNTQLTSWKRDKYPLRAGVSSFGVGGTNVHVVLEEAPGGTRGLAPLPVKHASHKHQLILLSAKTRAALDQMTQNLAEHFKKNPGMNLAEAAYTLQVGREAFPYRCMAACTGLDDAVAALSNPGSGRVQIFHSSRGNPPVVFMFPGQGSQYVNMGLDLYQTEPFFREEMDRCFKIINTLVDYDIKEILYPACQDYKSNRSNESNNSHSSYIDQTEIAQPVLFIFEYALAKLLIKWGIAPHSMTGHSIGEYAAACLAGVFSLEEALELVVLRGRLMQQMPAGAMLSVKLPGEQIKDLLTGQEQVELAAVNGPSLCVVSGSHEAIGEFSANLGKKGYRYQRLHTSHAFHSQSMDPILDKLKEKAGTLTIKIKEPIIPYISNVTGEFITPGELADPGYWAAHLRRTVRFSQGLSLLLKEADTVFIEVGPGRTLSTFVQNHNHRKPGHQIVNLIRHPQENVPDTHYLVSKIGQLWIYGKEIDWTGFHPGGEYYRIPLPSYPFARQCYWKLVDEYLKSLNKDQPQPGKARQIRGISDWFYVPSWKQEILPPPPAEAVDTEKKLVWILFMDECGLGVHLQERLQEQGHRVISVSKGTTFEKQDDHQYIINPRHPGDYRDLCKEVAPFMEKTGQIIHLWSVTGERDEDSDFRYRDFYQLLWLVQAMEKEKIDHPVQLTVVSDNMQKVTGQEILQPHKAMLLSPVKIVPQEYSNIKCRSIDILLPTAGSPGEKKLVDLLTAECTAGLTDTIVAFRSGLRWVQDYEPVEVEENIKQQLSLKIKNNSVWLITGGLGGIGLAVAKQLAVTWKARLVLTGRSGFPPGDQWLEWLNSHEPDQVISQKIRKLQEIKTMGAEVLVCQADAADPEQMRRTIEYAEQQFGKLNGVIHAAGVLNTSTLALIPLMDQKKCEQQFRPKIEGLQVLEKVLEDRDLDMCLLTSSLSSVLGGLGYAAYTAGNLFMDAFVQRHNLTNHRDWISVNLDAWQAQTQPPPASTGASDNTGQNTMLPEQGVEVLMRIMAWGAHHHLNQVVVSTTNLQARVRRWINLQSKDEEKLAGNLSHEPAVRLERPQLSTPYVEPRGQLEQQLADLWQDFFGIDKVGIHDNFFDLGASSLDLVQLSGKLKKIIGKDVPVVTLFRHPMISSLAKYLAGDNEMDIHLKKEQEKKRADEMQKGRRTMQSRLQLIKKG
jgi:acyl transferase domain-containing protein/acyl carrier protein